MPHSPALLSLLISSLLLQFTRGTPLPYSSSSPRQRLAPRYPRDSDNTLAVLGGSVGFIVLIVLLCSCCCCCGGTKTSDPAHTYMCNAAHAERQTAVLHGGVGQMGVDRVCVCPAGQGVNVGQQQRREEVPAMPGHEVPMNRLTADQVHAYNGQETVPPTEMIGLAPPPYSPPEGGVAILKSPEAAVVRPVRVQEGPSGEAVVWREGSERAPAPEVRRTGGWGRWSA